MYEKTNKQQEYITVLVCNGKHQYQARDDLEAFLGTRSADFNQLINLSFFFVCRLWGLLFNRARQSDSQITITALSDPIHVASVTTKDHHAFPSSFSLVYYMHSFAFCILHFASHYQKLYIFFLMCRPKRKPAFTLSINLIPRLASQEL